MDIGESLVAAYFKYIEGTRMIVHNAPYGQGQGEISLIAIDPSVRRAVLCEVVTHMGGMLYGSSAGETMEKLREKMERARELAERQFAGWDLELQIWSPVVSIGLAARLINLEHEFSPDLTVVVNERFSQRIEQLRAMAKSDDAPTDEPAYRLLQILARLK